MPSLTLPDRLIWFAHCPKAGGTSIEQIMVAHWGEAVGHLHWGWDLWWRKGGWRVADPPNSPQHLVWADAEAQLPHAPDIVFALVRDPVTRIASEYRWQRQKRRGTCIGKALAYLPFSLWLRVMLAVAARNPHAFDNHFRPQSDFIPECARVFRLEDGLDKVVQWLSESAGAPLEAIPIPKAIATRAVTKPRAGDYARIAHAYGADTARFGYSAPCDLVTPDWGDRIAKWLAPLVAVLDRKGAL